MSVGEILHRGVFTYVYPRQYWWFLWNVKPDYWICFTILWHCFKLFLCLIYQSLSNYCHLKMGFPDTSQRTWKQNNSLVCETRYWCFLKKKSFISCLFFSKKENHENSSAFLILNPGLFGSCYLHSTGILTFQNDLPKCKLSYYFFGIKSSLLICSTFMK